MIFLLANIVIKSKINIKPRKTAYPSYQTNKKHTRFAPAGKRNEVIFSHIN